MRATIDLCPSPHRQLVENIPEPKTGAGHSPNWRWFRTSVTSATRMYGEDCGVIAMNYQTCLKDNDYIMTQMEMTKFEAIQYLKQTSK